MARGKDKLPQDKPKNRKAAGQLPAKGPTGTVKNSSVPSVVGLGASAGGLEALEAFFRTMPATSHAAFVIVAHLDPTHTSLMPELLQKHTTMPVAQISDGCMVQPDHVYIIPPNKDLSILGGRLELLEKTQPRGTSLPIDGFFRSLAQDQGANAIGIILSGTGSDGTVGLKAIKAELGMTMVQSEDSAKYDGMPRNAIAAGGIDYILPPDQMPGQLIAYLRHAASERQAIPAPHDGREPDALQKVFVILRARTGHDFSLYKKNTIRRRIERRMHVHQLHDISDYIRFLQDSDSEANVLFKELLIGVTNFFRDADAFASLKGELKAMLKGKPEGYSIRTWVPGCSSGEEAYSIAILLLECMEGMKRNFSVQIFGTDIDENAVAAARTGLYQPSLLAEMSAQRLHRHFIREEDGQFRIKKGVREMLVFAPQNLIKDPPFTKLDLLCCRNLLIYLEPELQQRLLPMFHYSLKPGGILFLGPSETIGQHRDYFTPLDKKWKIFRAVRSSLANRPPLVIPAPMEKSDDMPQAAPSATIRKLEEISVLQMVEAILQHSDAPPCVIIDEASEIIYIHGKTGRYFEPAEGRFSGNVVEMVRAGLKKELADAIGKVRILRHEILCKGVHVGDKGGQMVVDLLVKPIQEPAAIRSMMMVVFNEATGKGIRRPAVKKAVSKRQDRGSDELEQELLHTRENLQTTIEELETSNEELKSANEELQSTNEELQSTNEELETSKEELQSLNEESVTVNSELQSRIDELSSANDDMKNLLDSTDIATVFLDAELCIRRFTPRANDIIPLAVSDAGRPLSHFATTLKDIDLAHDAGMVLDDLVIREKEVASNNGKAYLVRLRPYRTVANVIDGVVITFQDISVREQAEKALQRQVRLAEGIVNAMSEPLLVLDSAFHILSANQAFYATFAVSVAQTEGKSIYDLGNRQWDIPGLRKLLEDILPSNSSFDGFRVEHDFEGIGRRAMRLNARRIDTGDEELILLVIADEAAGED